MLRSLVPILPFVFEHIEPDLPHAFTPLVKSDYLHIGQAYQSLAACSLVCRSWRPDAQIALFRSAILSRPSSTTDDVFDVGIANGDAFLEALSSQPALGRAVLELSLSCDEKAANTAREILRLCPDVIVLVLRTHPEMDLGYYFCVFPICNSVQIFSHKGTASEEHALPNLQWTFPSLEELQAVNLEPMNSDPPIVELPHLHYIDICESDGNAMDELATSCPELDLDYLRIESLDSIFTSVWPFRRTLCVLDIGSYSSTNTQDLAPDDLEYVEDLEELRVLSIRRSPVGLLLRELPPKLQLLVIHVHALQLESARLLTSYRNHASLAAVTVYYNDERRVEAIDRFFEWLDVECSMVWDDW